ncbi:beta strand repeat-containing protein [Methanosalsum natronophilum]|uniref:beta strand repeat-containing protein n=1 Tax=Methanosalsum natronophilum TaxID=768733 RepID=UPI00216A1092|nr:hypothetical protein [Methanosalsum natronophilum]
MLVITIPVGAETVENLTRSNEDTFDGNIDIGVIYNGTTKIISVQYISDDTEYDPERIRFFAYNLDNDIEKVDGQDITYTDWSSTPGPNLFGTFSRNYRYNPAPPKGYGINEPIIFELKNTFIEPISPNPDGYTFLVHIQFSNGQGAYVTDFISSPRPDISIKKYTNGEDAMNGPGPFIPVGEDVTWTYNVTNTGNVDLTNVTVTDDQLGNISVIGDLPIGELVTVSATNTSIAGEYANIGTVTGEYNGITVTDEDPSHYFGVDANISIKKATNGDYANEPTGPFIPVNDTVAWTYNVTNTGNVNLTNITVTDNMTTLNYVIGTLGPGELYTVTYTGTAILGQYSNLGTATATYNGINVTDENASHYFGFDANLSIVKLTNGHDSKEPPGYDIPVGSAVNWTYVVTNTGNVDLINVTVTDNVTGKEFIIGALSSGSSTSVSDEGKAVAGQYVNLGTVTGEYNNITVTDEDPSHYFGFDANISITKLTNGLDSPQAPGEEIEVGSNVTWTYVVTNTGNVDLINVTVTDNVTGKEFIIGALSSGSSTSVSDEGKAVAGQYVNLGTVTGEYNNITVTDSDLSHYFGLALPNISITKLTNGHDSKEPPGYDIPVGSAVNWTYVVTNTGNVDLINVTVTDNVTGKEFIIGSLSSGSSTSVSDEEGTALAGEYVNLGTVTGEYNNITVTASDLSHYFGVAANISIKKSTNGEDAMTPTGPEVTVGSTVTWEYIVTNTGNVNLSNIEVTDNRTDVTPVLVDDGNGAGILLPGESWTYNATGIAVAGQYANLGNVTGEYNGITVTDEDPSHYFGVTVTAPNINIKKLTNGYDAKDLTGPEILAGSVVTWTYIVNNTGNVPLTNVTITDDQEGFICEIVGTFGVGATHTCTAEGTAQIGQYSNVGNVTAFYGTMEVSDEYLSHYFGLASPNISIKKYTNGIDSPQAPGEEIEVGSNVTWTYNVTNTGNVNLTNVTVTDNKIESIIGTIDNLGVNESIEFSANGTAVSGQYSNIGTVTAEYDNITVTDEYSSHYFGFNTSIKIKKYINGEDANEPFGPVIHVGNKIEWKFNITNTGNVKLNNITVFDDKLGLICEIDELEPGESKVCIVTGHAIASSQRNIATVTGWYNEQIMVTDDDPAHYFGYMGGTSADVPTATGIITVLFVGLFTLLYTKREKD